jgi:very-short-patch-repair endonuclease
MRNNSPSKNGDFKSSPPFQGGVAEGRGGYYEKFPTGEDKLKNREYLRSRRKTLRSNLTPAEAALWTALKNTKLAGRKFRRQQSVGNYILDFYCPSQKLAIELDGEAHFQDRGRENDSKRTLYLQSLGIRVIRFENQLVFDDIERVLNIIRSKFMDHSE